MFSTFTSHRSRCTCISDPAHQHIYPIGAEDACSKTGEWLTRDQECVPTVPTELEFSLQHNFRLLFADAECLQRAVEGRAASDEEEEDRGMREDGQCGLAEVKKHSCGKGLAHI